MAIYRYRCPEHGDFTDEQPMAETVPSMPCPETIVNDEHWTANCRLLAPKVLSGSLQFTYGRHEFKDGVDGTGETVRETAERWTAQHRAEGREPVPVGRSGRI